MLMIYFILILVNQVTSEVIYNGPATMDYFYNQSNADFHLLPELTCPIGVEFDSNPFDGVTNNYFQQTSDADPIQYYKLSITSEMKAKYHGVFHLSTSCQFKICDQWFEAGYSIKYCADYWMPSVYQNFIIATFNDATFNETSSIDIIPNNDVNTTFCDGNTSLDTVLYVLQEKKGQLNLIEYSDDNDTLYNSEKSYIDLSNYPEGEYIVGVGGYRQEYGSFYIQLQCEQYSYPLTSNQYQTAPSNISTINCQDAIFGEINDSVVYYLLNITDTDILPAKLDTSNWYTVIYIINATANKAGYHEQIDFDEDGYVNLSTSDYPPGEYWIILQSWLNFGSNYTLTMSCAPGPGPTLSRGLMMVIVFGAAGCCLLSAFIYYIYEWVKYNKYQKPQKRDQVRKVYTPPSATKSEISLQCMTYKALSGDEDDTKPRKMTEETKEAEDEDMKEPEQQKEDQDAIQMVLAHAIECCEDGEGFDVFQVLAIRSFEEHSREIRSFKPFERFGFDFEVIRLSIFVETVFIGIIIAATQTWGITVVVYKLVSSYFFDDKSDGFVCDMTVSHWQSVFSLKILSFLLSLVVTFFISSLLDGIKHNGLYEIMARLELQDIKRVNHIALWIAQIGQAVNYFVCLMAILGSYFIIFSSNQEDEDNYSSAGLDMILNAVALFFMLELDDLMVSDDDYEDCGNHLKWILENYEAKSSISGKVTENKCSHCIVSIMYYMINLFSLIVSLICYGGGFIAPFVIFFCW